MYEVSHERLDRRGHNSQRDSVGLSKPSPHSFTSTSTTSRLSSGKPSNHVRIPPQPIQFCVLGRGRGIQCDSQLSRRPTIEAVHDLVIQLVCYLIDFTWSLGNFCIDGLSSMFSSIQFWVSLFWWHDYFGLSSVLMLCSFVQSLDDRKLEPIYSIDTRPALALCSLWALFRQYVIHALVAFTAICVLYLSGIIKVLCSPYVAGSFGFTPLEGDIVDLTCPTICTWDWSAWCLTVSCIPAVTPWVVAVLGFVSLFAYAAMVYYFIWRAYIRWQLTLFQEDASRESLM
ncbi:hypothetical protein BDY19DRAFT_999127 [Irpex rosettiformis]|uniref:Uncharacterized protein n=1 Tax=Irpex rosettiformis TaxID=378272 RepID=A0ACB8TLL0_9APHY|nr:hypothetical protein BDY19DRAFT_999127 [Irpex rosettiformis]